MEARSPDVRVSFRLRNSCSSFRHSRRHVYAFTATFVDKVQQPQIYPCKAGDKFHIEHRPSLGLLSPDAMDTPPAILGIAARRRAGGVTLALNFRYLYRQPVLGANQRCHEARQGHICSPALYVRPAVIMQKSSALRPGMPNTAHASLTWSHACRPAHR